MALPKKDEVQERRDEFWELHNEILAIKKKSDPLREKTNELLQKYPRHHKKVEDSIAAWMKVEEPMHELIRRRTAVLHGLGKNHQSVTKVA